MQGQIDIHFQPLSIQSVRPFEIQTLCQNRTPEQVIQFIPLAYSLCGKAQKFAAQLALHTLTPSQQKHMAQQVVIETLKEHYIGMTQLLLCVNIITDEQRTYALQGVGNWGAKHTDSSDPEKTAQQIKETFSTLLPGIHHATTVNDDQTVPTILSLPIMTTLFQQIMPLNMPHELPKLHQQKNIEKYLFDTNAWDKWIKEPALDSAIENTAFSRALQTYPNMAEPNLSPLQQRVLGRVLDIVLHIQQLTAIHSKMLPPLFGTRQQSDITVSWVESARGRLFHMVQMNPKKTLTLNYAISAPTEWNFHPKGIAHQLMASLPQTNFNQWKKQVEQITQIIDPCVPIQIHKGQ